MNPTPLVAVVTPVYNGARFLAEAMDSVQAQTYENLVHVVLDNASTDATPDIIARYVHARKPVIVHRNAHTLPMSANWNAAVALTPPEAGYFRVLSADDLLAPDFIAHTLALAQRHPSIVAVGCGLSHRGEDYGSSGWDADREIFAGKEAAARFFSGSGQIIAHQILIRRSELDQRRPFFEEGLRADDTDALLDMLRRGDWGFVHETLAMTRDHDETDTNTQVKRLRLDACEHLILLERHAEFAFGPEEGQRRIKTYRRYYMRQLVRWRLRGEREIFARHMQILRRFKTGSLMLQFADAIANWPFARLDASAAA